MKIFVNKENAGWILDDIFEDYQKFTRHQLVGINDRPYIVWLLNFWELQNLLGNIKSPIYITIHHIVGNKIQKYDFDLYNKQVAGCIVPNKKTEEFLKKHLTVPVYRIPYWVLSKRMLERGDNVDSKKKEFCSGDEILIGSFQKDSEGKTNQPKLEKGPDVFLDIVTELKRKHNIKVILSGYNRRYLIENLRSRNIPFSYCERFDDLNLLYDCVDWCFVTSRSEGGPQSVLEAAYRKVKILSTDVGMAPEVLHSDCICCGVNDFVTKFEEGMDRRKENFDNVQEYLPQKIIPQLDDFFEKQSKDK